MIAKQLRWLAAVVLLISAQSCSDRAWFEGFKDRERSRCHQLISHDDIESCLRQVNSMTYDDYQRSLKK
ncbi:MAG: hypothetical protein ACR2PB_12510 [Desulfocapsaceae bacterium]